MNNEQVTGRIHQVAGAAEKVVGQMSDDQKAELKGAASEAAGKAKAVYGDAVESVRDYTERQPFGAIAVGVGVGILVGLLLRRGND